MLLSHAAQAVPRCGQAAPACGGKTSGVHACCAQLVEEQGVGACHCAETPSAPSQPEPAVPLPNQGREMVPQQMWSLLTELVILVPSDADAPLALSRLDTCSPLAQPHVRLTVLFCSFLT